MNLLTEPWLPVVRRDGSMDTIRPHEMTLDFDENPIVSLSISRPDWQGAMTEFLVGLISTCFAPKTDRVWAKYLDQPPVPEDLAKAVEPVVCAFELYGDGPRFMQDMEAFKRQSNIIQLLMDAPGDNTLKENKDLFFKRGEPQTMGQEGVAMALYTLQTYASGGGQGYRTGLRGGGPLTTLIVAPTLWQTIWWNVCTQEQLSSGGTVFSLPTAENIHEIFPWLSPTQTSQKVDGVEPIIHPPDWHPSHVYWTMPWRVRLSEPTYHAEPVHCSWLERPTQVTYEYFTKSNCGMNYSGLWRHPLSTYRYDTKKQQWIGFKSKASCLLYNKWPQHTVPDRSGDIYTTLPIEAAFEQRHKAKRHTGVLRAWCFGFDMDNAKAVCWYDGQMPIVFVDDAKLKAFSHQVKACVDAANYIQRQVNDAVNRALFGRYQSNGSSRPKWTIVVSPSQKALSETVNAQFWHDTTQAFYHTVEQVADDLGDAQKLNATKIAWAKTLQRVAMDTFHHYTAKSIDAARDLKAQVLAQDTLGLHTRPENKFVKEHLDLDIPNG